MKAKRYFAGLALAPLLVAVGVVSHVQAADQPAAAAEHRLRIGVHTADHSFPGELAKATITRVFVSGQIAASKVSPDELVGKLARAVKPARAAGMIPFVSFKPAPGDALAGEFDAHYGAVGRWAAAQPTPVWLTVWHEPENDFYRSAKPWRTADFVSIYREAYRGIKAAAGEKLVMGPVHQGYQWRPGGGNDKWVSDEEAAAWRVPADSRDLLGIDVYSSNVTGPTLSLDEHPAFQRWARFTVAGDWRQVFVAERGISRKDGEQPTPNPATQAETMERDVAYLTRQGALGWMYWSSGGATDNSVFTLKDRSVRTFGEIADAGLP